MGNTNHANQAVFDKIANHLLTQMEPAYDFAPDGEIVDVYWAGDGKKSAVGALIPADKYVRGMERDSVEGVLRKLGLFPGVDIELLRELERIHDRILPDEWQTALRQIAQDYGLRTAF
ncbi:hypothetical protein AB6802_03360 [Mesorhizobium sp. RCC_202]|uniref:hypothetical protein n=1 Tax=Mesorhizobium sp. RCC_202 TaxID=3239222 RepID=UPI0035249300